MAGGTGVVGRHVVAAVTAAGYLPIVLTRSAGVDLTTGNGLAEALGGVDSVIDVSSVSTNKAVTAIDFFTTGSRHLIEAGRRAGVRHHVTLSIVGIYLVGSGYYLGKQRQEELVLGGSAPVTVLRATQFHEFAGQMLERVPAPLMPKMLCQPVAAAEVGRHLVEVAMGEPLGMAPELAGPESMQLVTMARKLLRRRGSRRPILPFPLPGTAGRAMRNGGLLPKGTGPRGHVRFDDWLASNGEV